MSKNLVYDIHDKPKFGEMLVFALQQVLAILAATILVPAIVGHGMSQSAALFGPWRYVYFARLYASSR